MLRRSDTDVSGARKDQATSGAEGPHRREALLPARRRRFWLSLCPLLLVWAALSTTACGGNSPTSPAGNVTATLAIAHGYPFGVGGYISLGAEIPISSHEPIDSSGTMIAGHRKVDGPYQLNRLSLQGVISDTESVRDM
jgi:hypothetical protein